ncbi:YggS family pyridoxal phosphate-dependent enzyme [Acinetobacter guerrae]|uniref:Pyridoxal phosphate homeostasis protein n=1 Tax=Acinetobacter guerrae TaxID=1843371 RepID=A0A3A8EV35_9GAMM|nr:YggS family pyridoxal phosphate-dependent enzyme [Acinetobacter guerrae]MPW43662.1 YggS family pyridoxal phosphate enzyme [Acinetobacter guerrae]RKG33894.1 YggS family pyridoxal phosphate-dependent enzyme [Acinetobacter guerrae]
MNQFQQARNQVLHQIKNACQSAQRDPDSVDLLAVSKTHPSQALREMYQLGQRCFGENYLQEALEKIEELKDLEIEWHFIGHIQRNKTKLLAEKFDWVHGVDRLIIAERLSSQRLDTQSPLNLCIQVNIDAQESKDGCRPNEVAELVAKISQLPHIRLRGIMVIPAPDHSQAFINAKELFEQVKPQHARPQDWDTLSMGMSGDLNAAIAAGATIVRIGTALFGARDYSK